MSITRLQQARQMFRYGGDTMGGPNDKGANTSGNGAVDTGDFGTEKANVASTKSAETNLGMSNRDRAISNMYKNMPTPTITIGVDKFDNPINVPTTYTAKRNRQRAIDALNQKGISVFDPRVTKNLNTFDMSLVAQPKTKKFSFVRDVLFPGVLTLANPALGAKYSKAKMAYNTIKTLSNVAQTFGLTDTNVVDSFINSLTNRTTKTSKDKIKDTRNLDDNKDRDGIGSTPEMAALRDEYYFLLQKLQAGNILAGERNRLTALKNLLGIA
jgi:hypothetical protein